MFTILVSLAVVTIFASFAAVLAVTQLRVRDLYAPGAQKAD